MVLRHVGAAALAALFLAPTAAAAQEAGGLACEFQAPREELDDRASPPDSASLELAAGEMKICFGAPSDRGREIFGGLVPFDQPWRLGANEPTTLHLTFSARIGDVEVEPGSYALYAIPGPSEWEMVVNADPERWGVPIDEEVRSRDIGTTTVASESTDSHVEKMDIVLERTDENAANMVVSWENTRVSLPIRATGGNEY